MAFQYPLTQVFSAQGETLNVFDADTYEALIASGWLAEKPEPPAPALKPATPKAK